MKNNENKRAKRHSTVEIHVVKKHGFYFRGLALPKGSIFGYDQHGAFACKDYRLKTRRKDKRTGEGGFYKGNPCLAIFRPDNARSNSIVWVRHVEATPTSHAIFRYWEEHEECEIQNRPYKEVKKMAEKINDTRPAFGEVTYRGTTPYAKSRDLASHKKCTTVTLVVGHKTLEEIADEQRGKFVFTGVR